MMKTLLVHAKMQYIDTGDPQGLVRCETYQSHLDLLGILVGDNYTDLPTLQELTKKDYVMWVAATYLIQCHYYRYIY